tara:strand:- start:4359 stop:4517 length:159 start_codon:yes stop_codon:yes gene_type:complete
VEISKKIKIKKIKNKEYFQKLLTEQLKKRLKIILKLRKLILLLKIFLIFLFF